MKHFLKSEYISLEPSEILQSPTSILVGISRQVAALLSDSLNIKTVLDLAASRVFSNASLIVQTAEGKVTILSQTGLVPSNLVDQSYEFSDNPDFHALMLSDIQYISGIGPITAPALKAGLDTPTIRDLAYWPPYVNARCILEIYTGKGEDVSTINDGETPLDLLPATGQYPTERAQYSTLLFDRPLQTPALSPIEKGLRVDVMKAEEKLANGQVPALGALLSFTQSWYAMGLTLGQLLHSLALAPGESARVAVIDWHRQLQASATETGAETEKLTSSLVKNRSLNEVVDAVATEFQQGSSGTHSSVQSSNFGFGSGTGSGTGAAGSGSYGAFSGLGAAGSATGIGLSAGAAKGNAKTWTWSSSSGRREIGAEMTQNILDQTHQASIMARNRWASIVREVSQEEHETLSTRAVTNYNHMHAMTVQYYEVIQLYRVAVELAKVTRCLFVPMQLLDFNDLAVVKRFRSILASVALTPGVRELAKVDADPGSIFLRFPAAGVLNYEDRQYYQKWGIDNSLAIAASNDYVDIPLEEELSIEEFRFTLEKPDIVNKFFRLKSLIVDLQDGTRLQFSAAADTKLHNTAIRVADWLGANHRLTVSQIKRVKLSVSLDLPSTIPDIALIPIIVLSRMKVTSMLQHTPELTVAALDTPYFRVVPAGTKADTDPLDLEPVVWDISRLTSSLWSDIAAELNSNRLYYSQAIWQNIDMNTVSYILSDYSYAGKPLLSVIDSNPIGVAGGYLVFPFNHEDNEWKSYLKAKGINVGAQKETIIPLPSGGVFAEAVLGRANSAEKIDLTRFWNWSDSPIPITAPEIAALSAGSRSNAAAEGITPTEFTQPHLNIINSPSVPDPLGMTAVLTALQNGNMFRDMSGLAGAIGFAQASLQSAMTAAQNAAETASGQSKAAMEQAGKNLATAAQAYQSLFGKGGALAGTNAGGIGSPANMSYKGGLINEATRLDREEAAGKQANDKKVPGSSATGASSSAGTESGAQTSRRDRVLFNESGGPLPLQMLADMMSGATGTTTAGATKPSLTGIPEMEQAETDWARKNPQGHVEPLQVNGVPDYDTVCLWNFDVGSADVSKFETGLRNHFATIQQWIDLGDELYITGHASSTGTDQANKSISLKRAMSVKGWLTAQGLDPETIRAVGVGSSEFYGGDLSWKPEVLAKNRRVVIRRSTRLWTDDDYDRALAVVESMPDGDRKHRLLGMIPMLQDPNADDRYIEYSQLVEAYQYFGREGYEWLYDIDEWERHQIIRCARDYFYDLHPGQSDQWLADKMLALDYQMQMAIDWINLRVIHDASATPWMIQMANGWISDRQSDENSIYSQR